MPCPFCDHAIVDVLWESSLLVAFLDRHPVSPGHTLIVPRRHVGSFFALEAGEQAAMLEALNWATAELDRLHRPDAFNMG